MSTTTSYGYKVMTDGDLASTWMPDQAANWSRVSGHTHDGSDSALIGPASITKYTTTIASSGYSSLGGENYSKTITCPASIAEINNYHIKFYITSTGVEVFPTVERASATTYTLKVNEQLALTAVYV